MDTLHLTRSNLLVKRAQIKFARQGVDLLTRKKDALLREFLGILERMRVVRGRLLRDLRDAAPRAVLAEGVVGTYTLASTVLYGEADIEVKTRPRNLRGVRGIDVEQRFQPPKGRFRTDAGWGGGLAMEEVAADFEPILRAMVELAPYELMLRTLGEEIRKTNRKINALDQQLIPRLRSQARFIGDALEERARDDRFRLKAMKRKKQGARA